MVLTVLYPEAMYPDDRVEREVFGPDIRIERRDTAALSDLSDADCAAADGLMVFRHFAPESELVRFPRLRAVVRMGVGYDRLDRAYAARRGITICNVPDYGTTEVADHAMALALALRRGLLLHHAAQRADPPAAWTQIESPMIRRSEAMRFGIVGIGRIGTAVALRARAFGHRVICYDPFQPNGVERALGIERVGTLEALLAQADTLSLHAPLTRHTNGLIGAAELALLPKGAVVVNTARGPLLDLDALLAALRSGQVSGAGLDVIPVEPPVDPVPELLLAYRARAPWLEGRLIVTPHSAFHTPEAWDDIRRKSAETMRAALVGNRAQNVITPEMD
jgi:C-terminal binding protein